MSPENETKSYKRKIIFIKKAFQWKFILLVMALVATAVGIIAIDMFSGLGHYVSENASDPHLAAIYADSRAAFAVKVLIYLAGTFVVAMMVSHRLAGPLFRFERSAEKVAEGDLTHKVFLRTGDELLDLKDGFNDMIVSLHDRMADEMSHVHRVKKLLESLAADSALPGPLAAKVKEALVEAGKLGGRFKL